jgi:hydroxysqualene synthase
MSSPPVDTRIGHYENFPVASVLCPRHLRAPIAAIYHFARCADDIADEGTASAAERLQLLADYRQQLVWAAGTTASASASAIGPATAITTTPEPRWVGVFAALARTMASHQLPLPLLHDLLDAFVQDVEKTRDRAGYVDEAELFDYCRRSANPVGRLLLHLYGVQDAQSLRQSDAICTALQLINFWQDPSVDIPRGRFYFTQDARRAHGVTEAELLALRQTPAATRMIQHCVARARATMAQGAPLVHAVPGRAGWELRLVVQGGLRILDKIEQLHYATLQHRPTLRGWDFVVMACRALWM